MKLDKFSYLYSKPLGNHTLKIMKKNTWKFTKKTWKNHGILSVRKSGNPACNLWLHFTLHTSFRQKCLKLRCHDFSALADWSPKQTMSCTVHAW